MPQPIASTPTLSPQISRWREPPEETPELLAARKAFQEERAQQEQKRLAEEFERAFVASGIPRRHRETRIDIDAMADHPWAARYREVLTIFRDQPGAIVYLGGNCGGGKTQLAVEVAREMVMARRGFARYRVADELLAELRDVGRGRRSEGEVIDSFTSPGLLIIDEVDKFPDSQGWGRKKLVRILDKRYAELKNTLVLGNVVPSGFKEILGNSVMDRIRECGRIFECQWPSFRRKT